VTNLEHFVAVKYVWIRLHGEGAWVQSPQPLKANWDLEAEPPELGKFLQIFSKK